MFCSSYVDSCSKCSIDTLYLDLCLVWSKYEDVVAAIVWKELARTGGKTQVELVEKDLSISCVWQKIIEAIVSARRSFVCGE